MKYSSFPLRSLMTTVCGVVKDETDPEKLIASQTDFAMAALQRVWPFGQPDVVPEITVRLSTMTGSRDA